MKIFIFSSGNYGKRIVNHLATRISTEIVGLHEVPEDLPEFIEDLTEILVQYLTKAFKGKTVIQEANKKQMVVMTLEK